VPTVATVAQSSAEADWVSRFADEVIEESRRRAPGKPVVVASGLSPSGPIHLGNLREVMTPHLVADEIRRRGVECVHVVSWDDFDRFRKVPAGVDPSWEQHIGKPLTSVPAPAGSSHPNWAEHFKAPMTEALAELGVEFHGISQTAKYTSGAYREQVLFAMRERRAIDAILDAYRTRAKAKAMANAKPSASEAEAEADEGAALAAEGSGAAAEDDGASAGGYYPYKPYCSFCERDFTTVVSYDDDSTELAYTCVCGHAETVKLSEHTGGKLVWKVDWPMRWAYEGVVFEPSGVDHQSPGSSFVVGGRIVREIFGGEQPIGPMYAFVGMQGMAKMSSSKGGVPVPSDALRIIEPALIRWLYSRKRPNQAFTISFGQELQRLYDEWDALARKVAGGTSAAAETTSYHRAVGTASGLLPTTPMALPFGTLASVADITMGQELQIARILGELDPDRPLSSLDEVRPRLDRAQAWVTTQLAPEQRTQVRTEADAERLAALGTEDRESLHLLLDGLDDHWSIDGLTTLVYAVPKLRAGLASDAKPTPELKAAQRAFFVLLYELLVGRDTGPRLPTLLLAVGAPRVRELLGG
jgi:lysyl-tRNA synthetase class 1